MADPSRPAKGPRSEEHTSELQSHLNLVCRLLLEKKHGPRGRYAQLEPVVRRLFDIPFMTRLAVGPQWEGLTEAQRQEVSQAFQRYVASIYAERIDSYAGERLQVTGEQPSSGGTVITSQIVKSNGEPVNINYLMRD